MARSDGDQRTARWLAGALGGICVCVMLPRDWGWLWCLIYGGLVGFSLRLGMPWGRLLRRLGWFSLAVGVTGLGLAGHPHWLERMQLIWLRGLSSFWIGLLLNQAFTPNALIRGLRRLPVPGLAVDLAAFWQRYTMVLGEEWQRMTLAHRARTVRWNRRQEVLLLLRSLGLLFIRSYERGERVHRAMLARGYRG